MELNRKQFLQLGLAAPAAGHAAPAQQSQARRPNVLVLMSDQHRPDYLTCAGQELVPTPHIDRIAARGVRFTGACCPYPVCAASRMSLLTGLYPHHTGVINNTDRLDWRVRTMAHHFAGQGYLTALIGKMHFNDAHTHGFHYVLGFNDWFMCLGPKVQHYADEIANHPIGPQFFQTVHDDGSGLPELPELWGDKRPWAGQVKRIPWATSQLEPEDQFDAFVARETSRFIRRYKDQPFCLIAGFLRPHPPLHPPRGFRERYPVDQVKLPPVGDASRYPRSIRQRIERFQRLGEERLRAHRAGYLGNLAYVDTCIGEAYRALEEAGLVENTIVVYTSDHGEMDGDHGLYQKFCLFEPSVSVPLIVSWPGRVAQGKVSRALVEYMGLYPTLSELAGTPAPDGIDARSFGALVRDPEAPGPEAIHSEFNLRSNTDCYMLRTRRHKYIYNHGDIAELYDLEADPGELDNRAEDPGQRRVRERLHEQLVAWYDPAKNPYRSKPRAHKG